MRGARMRSGEPFLYINPNCCLCARRKKKENKKRDQQPPTLASVQRTLTTTTKKNVVYIVKHCVSEPVLLPLEDGSVLVSFHRLLFTPVNVRKALCDFHLTNQNKNQKKTSIMVTIMQNISHSH